MCVTDTEVKIAVICLTMFDRIGDWFKKINCSQTFCLLLCKSSAKLVLKYQAVKLLQILTR